MRLLHNPLFKRQADTTSPARHQQDLLQILGDSARVPDLPQRVALAIEAYIAELPTEKQSSAWQELPYLVQFGPILLKYGSKLPDIRRVNPGIRYGGLTEYEKHSIYQLLPQAHQLRTIDLLQTHLPTAEQACKMITDYGLSFPLMKKANAGERGTGIYYLADEYALRAHWEELTRKRIAREPCSLQEYCDREQEYCLQFYQMGDHLEPGSLTLRDIPVVIGDGQQSVEALIHQLPTAPIHRNNILEKLRTTQPDLLIHIPALDERVTIVRTASIDFGTKYLHQSLSPLEQEQLQHLLHSLLEHVGPQIISVGRFDLKAKSLASLLQGEVKVIELNAGGGIPTHVYDEALSVHEKYAELYTHFDLMTRIARINKRQERTFLSDLISRPAFLQICYQSIQKKGISFFDTTNAKGQQIKAIYKHILRTLSQGHSLRWQQRRRNFVAKFTG